MLKTAKTVKSYVGLHFGLVITVPEGSTVCNKTAMGTDDSYRFWQDYTEELQRQRGFKDILLLHDMEYRGINIPAEYCAPYPEADQPARFPEPAEVVEMYLCEVPHVGLRPNQLYRFLVKTGCEKCEAAAAPYQHE